MAAGDPGLSCLPGDTGTLPPHERKHCPHWLLPSAENPRLPALGWGALTARVGMGTGAGAPLRPSAYGGLVGTGKAEGQSKSLVRGSTDAGMWIWDLSVHTNYSFQKRPRAGLVSKAKAGLRSLEPSAASLLLSFISLFQKLPSWLPSVSFYVLE